MNWRNRRSVLILVLVVCSALFIAGMAAAFLSRHDTICSDRKAPVAERGALLGQVAYQCHDGEVVTLNN